MDVVSPEIWWKATIKVKGYRLCRCLAKTNKSFLYMYLFYFQPKVSMERTVPTTSTNASLNLVSTMQLVLIKPTASRVTVPVDLKGKNAKLISMNAKENHA